MHTSALRATLGVFNCGILSGGTHGFVSSFHNAARIRPSTRQAGLRNRRPLPQGPVRTCSGFLSPPAPRGAGGPGHIFACDCFYVTAIHPLFPSGRHLAGLFFSEDGGSEDQTSEIRGSDLCHRSSDIRQRGAKNDAGRVAAAFLHHDRGGIDAFAFDLRDRHIPARLSGA